MGLKCCGCADEGFAVCEGCKCLDCEFNDCEKCEGVVYGHI